jgi:serine/threonine protein kinase
VCAIAEPSLLAVAHWQVGTRYTLLKTLGAGSFSSVVAALDNDTGEKVRQQRDLQAFFRGPWLSACSSPHTIMAVPLLLHAVHKQPQQPATSAPNLGACITSLHIPQAGNGWIIELTGCMA